MDGDTALARPRPSSPRDLFWSFSFLALQGFGGVLAVVQRELVERKRWLSAEEFLEDWAVAQILPGPNVVNLALVIGDRHFGVRGAVASLAGMLTFPLMVVLALTVAFASVSHMPAVQGALRGMGAVAAGLVAGSALKLVKGLKANAMGRAACALTAAATFTLVALWRVPLGVVLLTVGLPACAWAWARLGNDAGGTR